MLAALYAASVADRCTNSYYQLMLTLVPVWAIFGLSWNLLSGYTGLISFGHAAFFGLGAYVARARPDLFRPAALGADPDRSRASAASPGLLIGYPTFRLQGHYFALAMLAYPLAMLYVFEWLGYQEITLPMQARTAAIAYMQFGDPRVYIVAGACDCCSRPPDLAPDRAVALWHGAARDQAERAGGGSRRHQYAGLEDCGRLP